MANDQNVLLTGAASGVGKAVAEQLTAHGYAVVALDIKEPAGAITAFHRCDLGNKASIDEVLGKLDGTYQSLMNVAGVPGTRGAELTMRVNLLGLRHLTEGVWDRISDGGTVVNVTSIAGNNWRKRRQYLNDLLATPDFDEGLQWWQSNGEAIDTDAYTFSKEALVLYTMQLAGRDLARGIRVNDVGPGPIETQLLPEFTDDVGDEMMQRMIGMTGRAAQPEDIAEAITVLAQGKIGWLNGQHVIVDGGMTAGFSAGWKSRD